MKTDILTIRNDFLFGKVFEDQELAKELLDRVLPELHIKELKYTVRQRDTKEGITVRGIRFDLYTENNEYAFGVEMHNDRSTFTPQRTRFYISSADMNLLEKGQAYSELKDLYVIIFCTYDPFDDGTMIYRYEYMHRKTGRLLNDGTHILYINCTSEKKEDNPEIAPFCEYTLTGKATDEFTGRVENRVQRTLKDPVWRKEIMSYEMRLMDERLSGYKKGMELGIEQGREQTMQEIIQKKTKEGRKYEEIAEFLDMTVDEVAALAERRDILD